MPNARRAVSPLAAVALMLLLTPSVTSGPLLAQAGRAARGVSALPPLTRVTSVEGPRAVHPIGPVVRVETVGGH